MSNKYPVYTYSNDNDIPNSAKADWVRDIINKNNKKFFKVKQPGYSSASFNSTTGSASISNSITNSNNNALSDSMSAE